MNEAKKVYKKDMNEVSLEFKILFYPTEIKQNDLILFLTKYNYCIYLLYLVDMFTSKVILSKQHLYAEFLDCPRNMRDF